MQPKEGEAALRQEHAGPWCMLCRSMRVSGQWSGEFAALRKPDQVSAVRFSDYSPVVEGACHAHTLCHYPKSP